MALSLPGVILQTMLFIKPNVLQVFLKLCYPSDKCRVSHVTPVTYVTLQNLFKLHGLLKSQKSYETFKCTKV